MIPILLFERVQGYLLTRQPHSRAGRVAVSAAHYALVLARDLAEGELSLRAMSLVYTSLLSVVPLLALAFSLLKALGVHNSLEPFLLNFFAPLGDQAPVLTRNVIGFVNNMRVGVLGSVGIGLLLYTAISMVHKVETSCNFLWQIPRTRGLPQRFGEYLSVMIIGPTLAVIALGLTASVRSSSIVTRLHGIEPFGTVILLITRLVPYLLMSGAFTFVYAYIPNTKVSLRAAATGGIAAGITWQLASVIFASFTSRATNYNAIYSGFAIVIFALIWLYVSWLILLTGCRLAFYVQNPRQLLVYGDPPPPSSREAEWVALRVVTAVGRRFLRAEPAPTPEELQDELRLSGERIERALRELVAVGVLAETTAERRLLPARDLETLTVAELWLRARGELPASARTEPATEAVEAMLRRFEDRVRAADGGSVRDWLTRL